MMDALTLEAVEAAIQPGYPEGAGAVLIVELDGPAVQVAEDSAVVEAICRECGSFEIRAAETAEERALAWRGRKSSFAAMGRISPSYYVQDGVVPRTKLPEVLRRIYALGDEYGLRIASVFHAGDGNLHPLVLYDDAVEGEGTKAERCATAILDICIEAGGSLTGEHGVGVDKACSMPKLFGSSDLAVFQRFRDAFDPDGIANPGKVIPTPRLCGEVPGPYRVHPLERAGIAERL
jgi:glycolate oxidase